MAIPRIASYPMPQVQHFPSNKVNWTLDPSRAVLLVHDLQQYFLDFYDQTQAPIPELIQHCRQTALQTAGFGASAEARGAGEDAVDLALHGVMHLLEGYWKLPAGDGFSLQLELRVNVFRGLEKVESVALSPGRLDLPVGYWTWVEEVE